LTSLALALAVVAGLVWISGRHDGLARNGAKEMVTSKVSSFVRGQREMTADNSIWTEAFEAARDGDIEWLYDNVGTAAKIGTVDLVAFVASADAEPVGWLSETPPEGSAEVLPPEILAALLERLEGTDPASQVVESAWARFAGDFWLLTVSRVIETDGVPAGVADEDLPRQIRGVRAGHLAAEIQEQFSLQDTYIAESADGADPATDSIALDLLASGDQAALVWTPPTPGSRIMRQISLPLAGVFVIFFLAAYLLRGYAVRSARRLESALVEAQAADRAKTQFLGIVSHELRTPMNGILGLGQLLQAEDLGHRQRTLLTTMMNCAHSQMRIIEALLDIVQIESGRRSLHLAAFNPSRVLRDVAEVARLDCDRKGLFFELEDESDPAIAVVGDEQALRQIVTNLVDNAIKFTKSGGVTIRATGSSRDESRIEYRIGVSDTGIGIDPADHARIFQHLTQLDSSATRSASGLGLGLSICRSLSEMMGGQILVESELGVGATFTLVVTLPLAAASPARIAA
jgi:signal transduction histidine kinase